MGNIQHLAILGSTGSIGTQTLDVVSRYPDLFRADVLTANENTELLSR
ncbi:MAG: 1-deoxy-D-xylulose-5-phosphate reductoisomerase, partial [Bacteroidales bacterium]|nr:1-deoxy-D-xylulose-5-phosphate reductoisomerase [Bacteroidales bacterium]